MANRNFSVEQLSFRFAPEEKSFFENISFSVPLPSLTFIQGRNGVGKSLLFRLITGVIQPHEICSGQICLDGKTYQFSVDKPLPVSYQHQVSLVCQKFDLMIADQFTFMENLQLAHLSTYPGLKIPREKPCIQPALQSLAIDFNKPAYLLSGGQRQILAITMALQKSTRVLLLDEPTAALDDHNAEMVMNFLHTITHASALVTIVISHDRDLIERFSADNYFELAADPTTTIRTLTERTTSLLFQEKP